MSLIPLTADELFVGKSARQHSFYSQEKRDGKIAMHDAVEDLFLRNSISDGDTAFRFMSLPGKFWRFELRLMNAIAKFKGKVVQFTGFERDPNVILSGAGYVPHSRNTTEHPRIPGFRMLQSIGVEYFKTNRARWLRMDVNTALTMDDSLFADAKVDHFSKKKFGCNSAMELWLLKFCRWDAVWLDYYSPISEQIGGALNRLGFHCRQHRTPVAVTVLKGRENIKFDEREKWLASKLGGSYGSVFKTIDYHEYSDGASTMCNILGVILNK